MPLFQNTVSILGWVRAIYPAGMNEFRFELLEPNYHEHFRAALSNDKDLLSIEVITFSGALTDACRTYLEVGHRVQVFGRLVPTLEGGVMIEAWRVERAEELESFRYTNHMWNYDLKSISSGQETELQ